MKKLFCRITLLTACGALAACGDDAVEGDSVVTMGDALNTLSAALTNVGSLAPGGTLLTTQSKGKKAPAFSPLAVLSLATDWDSASAFGDPRDCGSDGDCATGAHHNLLISIKEYMGLQIDGSDEARSDNGSGINVLHRFQTAMAIPCAIVELSDKAADGYPANGAQSVVIIPAKLIECGMSEADAEGVEEGTEISIVVSTPSDTSVYDKKVVLDLESISDGDNVQTMYFKTTTAAINVASVETYTRNTNAQISRTLVGYSAADESLSVEYVSTSDNITDGGFYLQRVMVNSADDTAAIFSHTGNSSAGALGTYFTLAGKPEAGGTLALSLRADLGTNTLAASSACVNIDDGTIESNGSLACTLDGKAVDDAEIVAMDGEAFAARAETSWTDISLSEALSFDATTIFTQNATH